MLPIGWIVGSAVTALLGASSLGCRSKKNEGAAPSEGSPGKAAAKTHIEFHDGNLGEVEKREMEAVLKVRESEPRRLNSALFSYFNGFKVVSRDQMVDLLKLKASQEVPPSVYRPDFRDVLLGAGAVIDRHLCRSYEQWYSFGKGARPHTFAEWAAVSCFEHPERPSDQCVMGPKEDRTNPREEWLEACSEFAAEPESSLQFYASMPLAQAQMIAVSKNLGYPQEAMAEILGRLNPIEEWKAKGRSRVEGLVLSPKQKLNLASQVGEGAVASNVEGRVLKLFLAERGDLPLRVRNFDFPERLDLAAATFCLSEGKLLAIANGRVFQSDSEDRIQEVGSIDGDASGDLTVVGGSRVLLQKEGFLLADAQGKFRRQSYPGEVGQMKGELWRRSVVWAEGKPYLWLSGVREPEMKFTNRLYALEKNAESLNFRLVWRNSFSSSFEPFFYRGAWHLQGRTQNDRLSDQVREKAGRAEGNRSRPAILRVEGDGKRMTPIVLRYAEEKPEAEDSLYQALGEGGDFLPVGAFLFTLRRKSGLPAIARWTMDR